MDNYSIRSDNTYNNLEFGRKEARKHRISYPNHPINQLIEPHTTPNPDIPTDDNDHRIGDPIFAVTIGAVSAVVRIRREQREQAVQAGRDEKSIGFGSILETGGRRYNVMSFNGWLIECMGD
ncbi:hypothetical protein T310_9597 [Rasamsonia emersonii CBS 393.64]|uniref:Uncharacterized protein n=1 Tax=Rasamsonia emersonii (strain ATCC 16479 / CBS 393.64 / IMI 116815) TaxID=1408163 RepID=A0A0F4YEY1_RASE3|nr:hypothetical protein T310_9597 [Rasamsonia emersonii CBS 393.64]KKA16777.1 hypothetical protein T310_9597 [Rasamsonia emersonii CBS 393.64]